MIRNFEELLDRARTLGPARIAVVEAHDPDVLESLKQAEPMGLAVPALVGNPDKIEEAARKAGYKLRADRDRRRRRAKRLRFARRSILCGRARPIC